MISFIFFHSSTSHITIPLVINAHPMLTRGKTSKSKPKVYMVHSNPTTFKQVMPIPKWLHAMKTEYDSFLKKQDFDSYDSTSS